MASERFAPELRDLREAWEILRHQVGGSNDAELPSPTPAEGPDPYGNPEPAWLGIDWRQHLSTVDVDGARVNYVDAGPGFPAAEYGRASDSGAEAGDRPAAIVFVHGLAGCWQNWLEQIPHFAAHRRVVALDLSGSGHSPMPPWEISIPAYGALVARLCDRLGVDDAVLVGNSMGGFITAEAVCANPRRFDRLVLVAAAGISSAGIRAEPAALAGRLAVGLAPLALSYQDAAMRRPKLRRSAFGTVFWDPSQLRTELLYEQYTNGSGRPGFLPALTSLIGYDFVDRIQDVDTPTLIVAGRNDLIVPPTDAIEYGRLLRNSQTVIFDRTGHCPQLERPVRFNRLLEAFLDS